MGLIFQHAGIHLEYEVIGQGSKTMFAFHGFGTSSDLYRVLEPSLGRAYQIYSFNLPFHGKSFVEKPLNEGMRPEDLENYFSHFLRHIEVTEFSLAGYSLGGKVALKLAELFPEKVKDIFLFAPDGITISNTYRFITKTRLGNWLYRRMLKHPRRYLRIISGMRRLQLVNAHLANLAERSLDTGEKRHLLFQSWWSLRYIEPDIPVIQNLINEKKLNAHLFFGKADQVIPVSIGEKFVRDLDNRNILHVLDAGHQLIREKTNEDLWKILSV